MLVGWFFLACGVESGVNATTAPTTHATARDPSQHDADHDGVVDADDCRPYRADIHPDAPELCDGEDNDCDGKIDEGDFDDDGDGYDDLARCWTVGGSLDCDDGDPAIHPGAREVCDTVDQDCSGEADDADYDGDSFAICDDCDDADAFSHPDAAEACDGIDNDCDFEIDEIWDFDGDGFSGCMGDCDDGDAALSPGAGDECDGVDNDCDGKVDEDDDVDGDGVATCSGDCDDGDASVYAGATELCDGHDNDCVGGDAETDDNDGDGFSVCTGDCDDADAAALPTGTETCDGTDNNCDGYIDENPSCYSCSSSGSYYLCTSAQTWQRAESACESFGGTLAVVTSSGENDDLATLAARPAWIGANDRDVEGDFVWPTGAAVSYDSFAVGQPDDAGDADCTITNLGGRRGDWSDEPCSASYQFLCEF